MIKPLNIVIIGIGNVAYHIAQSFQSNKNVNLLQVFNHRNSQDAKHFSKHFSCDLITDYTSININADIYIIAVKDDAIAEVSKNLSTLRLKGIVAHTSGSIDMPVLQIISKNIGVYYPLQTFYKDATIDWENTPLLIEGNSKLVQTKLKQLANLVSKKVNLTG